ncbi:MAG: hypothetical protein ACYSWU_27265 [Planctomycetota bacterium]|jgi:hypothetical protein
MNAKPVIWALFALLVICVLPSAAAAANGPYFAWRGYGLWTYGPPRVYALEQRPYFALHPPVYYSYPVSRTYGHLPYPYLPRATSRRVARIEPQVVVNQYAAGPSAIAAPAKASLPARVQVVYPAATFDESK